MAQGTATIENQAANMAAVAAPMPRYVVGDMVRLQVAFANENGTPTNPTTVTLDMIPPDQVAASIAVAQSSTGVWFADFIVEQNGLHQFRFAGVGAIDAAAEAYFMGQSRFS